MGPPGLKGAWTTARERLSCSGAEPESTLTVTRPFHKKQLWMPPLGVHRRTQQTKAPVPVELTPSEGDR